MCKVVHCKKSPYDVYIGRPSKWGNPFVIGKDGDRNEVVKKYEEWIRTQPNLLKDLVELKGKILGCWCSPLACHGDVLVRLANSDKRIFWATIPVVVPNLKKEPEPQYDIEVYYKGEDI